MKVADKAYLAGLLDGEGTVCVAKLSSNSVQLRLQIVNTYKPVLDWVLLVTGEGRVRSAGKGVNKPVWIWVCSTEASLRILDQIRPYLKIKRAHAEAVRNFPRNNGRTINFPKKERELRFKIREKVMALNAPWRQRANDR